MPKDPIGDEQFDGFVVPSQNWFRLPNEWTNITARMKSLAELKVVEYVLRHTWGYHEYGMAKKISISEFMHGRRREDGSRIDHGTGLSNRSVIDGLRNAVQDGFLVEEVDDRDKGRIQKSYQLRMRELQSDVKDLHGGMQKVHAYDEVSSHRTEKDTTERNLTVNGEDTTKSPLSQLPDLDQPTDKRELMAEDILARLGDRHSRQFYRLVAAKVPAPTIYQALSEIEADGADDPRRVFTYRMNRYALAQLTKRR